MPVRVLIVDDHASFRWLARLLLVVAGFDVIGEAADAGGARELVERLHPDAVLLDVMLPDGSGVEVARELKRWANGSSQFADVVGVGCVLVVKEAAALPDHLARMGS